MELRQLAVLRRRRAPPELHARGRRAVRHPAGALAAGAPAGGGAGRRAAAAHARGRRADRGGRGPRRARRADPRRGGDARAAMEEHAGARRGVARSPPRPARAPRLPAALAGVPRRLHPGIRVALRQGSAAEVVALVAARLGRRRRGRARRGGAGARRRSRRDAAGARSRCGSRAARRPARRRAPASRSDDLRGRPFVLAEPGTALRETVMAATQAAGFSPLPLLEVGDPARCASSSRAGSASASSRRPGCAAPGAAVEATPGRDGACATARSLLAAAAGRQPAGRLLHEHLLARPGRSTSSRASRALGRAPTSVQDRRRRRGRP